LIGYFSSYGFIKKQNRILFKSWGDSPKKKGNISANVCVYAMFTDGRILSPSVNMGELEKRAAYTLLYDVRLSTYLVTVP